jgi:hypothetical protein
MVEASVADSGAPKSKRRVWAEAFKVAATTARATHQDRAGRHAREERFGLVMEDEVLMKDERMEQAATAAPGS